MGLPLVKTARMALPLFVHIEAGSTRSRFRVIFSLLGMPVSPLVSASILGFLHFLFFPCEGFLYFSNEISGGSLCGMCASIVCLYS